MAIKGTVTPNAPFGDEGWLERWDAPRTQNRQLVSLLELFAWGDPAGGVDVHSLLAVVAQCRGPAV